MPEITKALVGARHGVKSLVANGAGAVVHGRIIGIRQRNRVGCSGR